MGERILLSEMQKLYQDPKKQDPVTLKKMHAFRQQELEKSDEYAKRMMKVPRK